MNRLFHDIVSLIQNQDGTTYLTSSSLFHSSHGILTTQGNAKARYWDSDEEVWEVEWKAMLNMCDVYGTCGAFGSFNKWVRQFAVV